MCLFKKGSSWIAKQSQRRQWGAGIVHNSILLQSYRLNSSKTQDSGLPNFAYASEDYGDPAGWGTQELVATNYLIVGNLLGHDGEPISPLLDLPGRPQLRRQTNVCCQVQRCGAVREEYGENVFCRKCGHKQISHNRFSKDNFVFFDYPNQPSSDCRMDELFMKERIHLTEYEIQILMGNQGSYA